VIPCDHLESYPIRIMIEPDSEEARAAAAKIIERGGIIAFRTDTFYGLGADPLNRTAVQRIKELKGREDAKPILLLISDLSQVARFLVERSHIFNTLAQEHWPGPLTLIGQARAELPQELTAGTGTIGLRLPDDDFVTKIVRACGGALTATSANVSGQPASRSAAEVAGFFPVGIDLILDGGETEVSEASTVVDVSGASARLVREGRIKREQFGGLV
jgi:L-threonylcarbamoyladenylate synthase